MKVKKFNWIDKLLTATNIRFKYCGDPQYKDVKPRINEIHFNRKEDISEDSQTNAIFYRKLGCRSNRKMMVMGGRWV